MTDPSPLTPRRRRTPAEAAQARAEARAPFDALPPHEQAATLDRIGRLLLLAPWQFARTMPENPHEYTLRKHWHDEDFVWTVEQIRTLGYRQKWQGRWYTVFDANGYFFWTLGWPIGDLDWGWNRLQVAGTVLINRKPLPEGPR